MRLKPDVSESGISKDNLVLRCGDCMHYDGTRSPLYEDPCKKRGILSKSIAPKCYTPNIAVFKNLGPHFYQTFSLLVANMRPSSLRVLAGVIKSAPALSRKGFSLFEKVYFAVGNPKYLSNYFSGYVISSGVTGDLVLVAGSLRKSARMVTASLAIDSVLTLEQFVKLRSKLIEKGALIDPETVRTKFKPKKGTKAEDYEPPTIDTAQDDPKLAEKLRKGVRIEEDDDDKSPVRLIVSPKKMVPDHLVRGMSKRKSNDKSKRR